MAAYRFRTTWLLAAPRDPDTLELELEILRNERPKLLVDRASGELAAT
jgi:hypothetical protein